jgi:hypothetical protein
MHNAQTFAAVRVALGTGYNRVRGIGAGVAGQSAGQSAFGCAHDCSLHHVRAQVLVVALRSPEAEGAAPRCEVGGPPRWRLAAI